ncbi:autotransporter outer membrane beta-barrel domain-containing protein [Salmonella enterica]|uniref:autotransporter outer membrane beta-barrel domain-containing protein n=1 Tax=Salmonella enterica TaxID=28901 RepID=UPI00098D19A3|nr:autotransporter outer membrane beta-barrel domain-containing protein [Salmonella enterica]EBL5516215.1 autotransporter outer membrane beta-barrel domain-containing protein [Salmonella enterica subsp. enterica serovar Newport]EAO3451650.1 autotransporter outer membrane beta-barrel domain-containing protein [Salmonella enterica]EAS6716094.1 autotransporter outer membrane beta-barrel domain-containing protein [Salmonella enterica]EAT2453992.1 autotransporter outer membrane beta-barrel domain-co
MDRNRQVNKVVHFLLTLLIMFAVSIAPAQALLKGGTWQELNSVTGAVNGTAPLADGAIIPLYQGSTLLDPSKTHDIEFSAMPRDFSADATSTSMRAVNSTDTEGDLFSDPPTIAWENRQPPAMGLVWADAATPDTPLSPQPVPNLTFCAQNLAGRQLVAWAQVEDETNVPALWLFTNTGVPNYTTIPLLSPKVALNIKPAVSDPVSVSGDHVDASFEASKVKVGESITLTVTTKACDGEPAINAPFVIRREDAINRQGVVNNANPVRVGNTELTTAQTEYHGVTDGQGNATVVVTQENGPGVKTRLIVSSQNYPTLTDNVDVIFTTITSPDSDKASMYGHMIESTTATLNGITYTFTRPKLAAEASGADKSVVDTNETWALFDWNGADNHCNILPDAEQLVQMRHEHSTLATYTGWPATDDAEYWSSTKDQMSGYHAAVHMNSASVARAADSDTLLVSCVDKAQPAAHPQITLSPQGPYKAQVGESIDLTMTVVDRDTQKPLPYRYMELFIDPAKNRKGEHQDAWDNLRVTVDSEGMSASSPEHYTGVTDVNGQAHLTLKHNSGLGVETPIRIVMPDDEGGNVELSFSVIFTVVTSPDVDGANMWGHMRGVVDAGNLYKRPLLAVEASHKDGQFSENNEEWATFNSVASATAQCGVGQVPDQSSLAHLYSEHAGGQMESEHGWPTEDYFIAADSVALGGTLNVTGIGSVTDSWTPEAYTYTLIGSDSAITTDFDDLTVAGMNREDVDFLTIDGKVDEADNTHYDLTASLSWYADRDNATTDAHGTFTLSDPDGGFNVAATLTDVDDTLDPGSRWDGKSLTKEGAGTLILSGDNDYSGGTTINEGTLVAASTTALGTGLVDNNATLVLDVDGEVSAVGGITTHSGATTQLALGTSLDLGDSALIQQDGSTLNVELNSDSVQPLITGGSATLGGDLVVSDASLQARASDAEFQSFKLMDMDSDISGDFTSLTMNLTDQPDYLTVTGTINPADASEYLLTEGLSWNATATSATPAHGTFTLSAGDSFEVISVLGDKTGNGDWDGKSLTKLGAGKLTLSGANTYSGDTNVQEGTLWLTGAGTIGEVGSQQAVNVASDATFGGSNGTTVNGKVTNEGTLVFGDSEETGAIFTLNGDLINMGTITSGSSSSTPGNTLYVDGDYTGNGGSLYLNTVLGDDDSATDKLVITGDASGTTDLYINGIGDGAQTTNGIEVVDVGGVSTSDAFVLKNEVNASLYTYRLYWNESDNDWYLASKAQSDDDDSGGDDTPSDGGDDGGNVTPPDDGGDGGDVAPQYRADIGAYMGNQWMARNLQMQTLYDREGSQYRNADGSVWARFKAGKAESEAVSGNIDMDSNYSQFQLGGDILAWGNGQQSVTVGVMASYINADTDSTGNRGADGSQFTSSGNVDGYNLGVYATWFADAQTHSGAYVDSWYQYGFYNNSVESGDAGSESYDSTANAVSLETGYRYDIALSNGNTVSLTPQAQVVWQNYSADSVKDNYGTRIDGQDGDSWTTRLGLRVDGKLYKGSRTVIQPFAEANWLHTSDDVSVSFDDATVKQDLPANRAELKVGLQADIDKQWSVRAQVAGQTGSNDFGDLNGSLNLRYNW